MIIIPVKCPRLNLKEGDKAMEHNPVLEVLLKFDEDLVGDHPTHILGCPKYNPQAKDCNIKNQTCIYSTGWKELKKP